MKFLAAIVLLIHAVAEAHHSNEHTLRGPRFLTGRVHIYEVEFNVTSGVRGLSSQVSKSAFKAELHIQAKSEKEHVIKIGSVFVSGAVKAAAHKDENVPMRRERDLEDKLSIPIKFTMENGKVTRYTLSPNESLESKKIKKSILRSLEMHVPEVALQQMESSNPNLRIPVTYNTTEDLGFGPHTTQYIINVSPDVEFPYNNNVYNISRSENFEGERYHSHVFHHNFRQQGCSEVCKMDWSNNKYGAGCPATYEPHHSPMKMYVHHQHHLALDNGIMTPEIITTTEVHSAKMYDQDMEVLIRHYIRKIGLHGHTLQAPAGQTTYTNLESQEAEINEQEIDAKCEYQSSREAIEIAKRLLRDIAGIIVNGNLENRESAIVGEKMILLKSALFKLKESELRLVSVEIIRKGSIQSASEEEKVKRQIWTDILPLIGTQESVSFIVGYIKENVDRELFVWEAKEILESLPQNIHIPTQKTIRELRSLLNLSKTKSNHLLFSATYSCLSRVISSMCKGKSGKRVLKAPWSIPSQEHSSPYNKIECPVELVSDIVQEFADKLQHTKKQDEIVIYVENLIRIGIPEVLPIVTEYIYGTAQNIQEFSPSYTNFVKSAALYSLHSIAPQLSEDILPIVMPIYFNETEIPKIRTAAFGVLIRCQPSLETLQHVAIRSWTEKSNEVGSYVTSTLETFGNSTLPCMLLTAYRIKQVMPMAKRFSIGAQHAKNMLWSYFDDIRMFGLKEHLAYTPSTASIIPSALYQSLSYSTSGMSDSIIEMALNIEGLTQKKLSQYIDEHILEIFPAETIPSSKKNEIFGQAKVFERIPETLRFTFYKRMFYSSSFYYLDLNSLKSQIDILKEYLEAYLKRTPSDYSGHLVKVFLPASFHTVTIAKTLHYPVEFQMHQPMIFALGVESKESNPTIPKFHLLVRPSVYLANLFTNQLKNLGDCKEVGVYHENKLAISYPIQVKFQIQNLTTVNITYKLPELPKKILHHYTEAGTYAGKKSLETLPSSAANREPIRTLPSPFKNSTTFKPVVLPPLHVESLSEDIGLITENPPMTPMEMAAFAVKNILNAGWRYKDLTMTIKDDSEDWPKNTEVTFDMHYNRSLFTRDHLNMSSGQKPEIEWPEAEVSPDGEWITEIPYREHGKRATEQQQQSYHYNRRHRRHEDGEEDWPKLLYDDFKYTFTTTILELKAATMAEKLYSRPHINQVLEINMETRPVHSQVYFRLEYNHSYTRSLQAGHVDAFIREQNNDDVRKISFDHLIGFSRKPDEFHYNTHVDDQEAVFFTALRSGSLDCSCPWKNVDVIARGKFSYEPLEKLLKPELLKNTEHSYFVSAQHEQCLEDVRNGYPLSMNCVKAMREGLIYNKLNMIVTWHRHIPENVTNWAHMVDRYIKHYYYNHMSVDDKRNRGRIDVNLKHINRFTDEPVFDVIIEKPKETITLQRMRAVNDPLSSLYDTVTIEFMGLTNNTYPPTCVMMEKYLSTFDLKSYPLSLDHCNYVLSAHCSEYKNYAITAKILSIDGQKEIHIHVGTHLLVLSPKSDHHYPVKYDGRDYNVTEPLVFDEEEEIYVYPLTYASRHTYLEVVAQKAGINVKYTGKNVKLQIDPRYKGETCGLCSDFNGEIIREFKGMDKCLYSHPDDFVNSAITNKDTCRKQPQYPRVCEEDERMLLIKSSHEHEPTLRRNIVTAKGSEICFSVHPVPVCEADKKPIRTESLLVGFHCLPKHDITTKRLISESKRRALGEIENKHLDYEEVVQIAKMC